jgi:hypothetical protein
MAHWKGQRGEGEMILSDATLERIFRFDVIHARLARLKDGIGLTRVAFADWGKGILPFHMAAMELGLRITAVVDRRLAGPEGSVTYRGIPVVSDTAFREHYQNQTDAVVLTPLSPVHASRRGGELRRAGSVPVIDLFAPRERAVQLTGT